MHRLDRAAAYERGYDVTILSDCSSARTDAEQQFFCEDVFPLYGRASSSVEVLDEMTSTPVWPTCLHRAQTTWTRGRTPTSC